MLDKIKLILRFLKYFFSAGYFHGHGIHSPFLFQLINNVLFVKEDNKKYNKLNVYRKFLSKTKSIIEIGDKGAGSQYINARKSSISLIDRHSSTKRKYGRLIARMVDYFNPSCIIELGTSLGVGTCYLSLNMQPDCILYTIEGSENLFSFALKSCDIFQQYNIIPILGNFDETLPDLLKKVNTVDLVYLDGNHRKEPTIRYFEELLPKLNNNSVLIFDDIHWSQEMEEAWQYIKSHDSVKLSLDLFQIGIIFFRKELSKEDFILRF
jgi:predicted O-methyltransferase YrrM